MPCKWQSLSCVRLFLTPQTIAHQAPLSMGFFRQEYWSGLPFPFPGELPDPGIKPGSPVIWADALQSEPPGKPLYALSIIIKISYAHKTQDLKIFGFINWLFNKYCAWVETSWVTLIFIKLDSIGCMYFLSLNLKTHSVFTDVIQSSWNYSYFGITMPRI